MTLQRLPDWPERLAVEIESWRTRAFQLGSVDCGHFVVECCIAVTGVDVGATWRGAYDSEIGLARLYVTLGVEDVAGWADVALGPDARHPVAFARRGDWVLSPEGEPPALGLVDGINSIFLEPAGLTTRPTLNCRTAWKVGE